MTDQPPRRSLTVATAGHVDHGKTLLVRNLTGIDTDTLAEEKQRGLSINLGFAYRQYEADGHDCLLGFVDVPGHIDFIGNMLAGVGAVDAALLVVAADDGVMPQTEEHAAILDLLDIRAGCVALTKKDRASKTRLRKVKAEVRELLAGGCLAGAPVFPVSNIDGEGVDRLGDFLRKLPLAGHRRGRSGEDRMFRFLVDRSFSVRGIGTVVTGSCRAGEAAPGRLLLHGGSGSETRIRGIQVHRQERDRLRQGERAALNITLGQGRAGRGDWLLDARLRHPVARFDARLRLLRGAAEPRPGARCHLHIGASHQLATLRRLGDSDFFQLKTREPVDVLHGDRFILRDPAASRTLGGGRVIDIFVPARGRETRARLALLAAMDQEPEAACRALIELLPEGLDLDRFGLCRNLGPAAIARLAETARQAPTACIALAMADCDYPRLLGKQHYLRHRRAALAAVADYHRAHPDRAGIGESQLPQTMKPRMPRPLLQALVARLLDEGALERSGSLLRMPGRGAGIAQPVERLLRALRPVLRKSGKIPPRTRELAEITGLPLAELAKILRQAEISGQLVKVADNRHYLPETVRELALLAEKLAGGPGGKASFSVVDFRDASGVGRNLCIEILEYFDGVGFTRRQGNVRFVRASREQLFGPDS